MSSKILKRRKEALKHLEEIFSHPDNVFIIHYSCESFYDRVDGASPRITSIAVRNLDTGQTHSFSIHKVAELKGVNLDQIETQYNELEKDMLEDFFAHVSGHRSHKWLHWNMRDINYGFQAIEHRFSVLGGEPTAIEDANKFDLSRILVSRYGTNYIGHPRLESLLSKNHIQPLDFLTGRKEADAFEEKNYVSLHQSTLRKADILSNIAQRAYEGTLKTNLSWREMHGYTVKAFAEWLSSHWAIIFLGVLAMLGAWLGFAFDLFKKFSQ